MAWRRERLDDVCVVRINLGPANHFDICVQTSSFEPLHFVYQLLHTNNKPKEAFNGKYDAISTKQEVFKISIFLYE